MRKYQFIASLAVLAALAAVLATTPAVAGAFIVTMKSGSTFETKYQPHQSEIDEDKILLLTGYGNWISLPKDAVESVQSDTEARGFGTVLDSATIALGWSPNSSVPQEGADSGEAEDPTSRLIDFLREQNAPQPQQVFSNELIVEPSDLGGIPVWGTDTSTPPIGSARGPN